MIITSPEKKEHANNSITAIFTKIKAKIFKAKL